MKSKWIPYVLVIALALILFFVRRCQSARHEADVAPTETRTSSPRKSGSAETSSMRDRGFDRTISHLEYTQHAKCRMRCRHISQREVEEIMRTGKINYAKSDLNAHPCPEYAVEGMTSDDQQVRIVFGQCNLKTKVITTIDLKTEWTCACPGDD